MSAGSMTLGVGGSRSAGEMRTADDRRDSPAQSYEYFADRDTLTRA